MDLFMFLVCGGTGIASFLIGLKNGKPKEGILIPPTVSATLAVLYVVINSRGLIFGLVGTVVYFLIMAVGLSLYSVGGYYLGSYVSKRRNKLHD